MVLQLQWSLSEKNREARPCHAARNATDRLRLEWRLALFRTFAALAGLQAALAVQWRQGAAALGLAPLAADSAAGAAADAAAGLPALA